MPADFWAPLSIQMMGTNLLRPRLDMVNHAALPTMYDHAIGNNAIAGREFAQSRG